MSSESLSSIEDEQRVGLISNMEARADHETFKRFRLFYVATSSVGLLLVVLMFVWTLKYRGGFGWIQPALEFNWHPVLMIVGLIFIYSQSMMIFRTGRNAKKKILKLTHAGLHFLTFILAVIALKAAFDSHNYAKPPKPNLYTLHSWIGLVTVILFAYQFLSGFLTFLYPGLSKNIRAIYLPVHTNFGTAIFFFAVITAAMGFLEKAIWAVTDYSNYDAEGVLINFMGVLLVGFGALVLYLVNYAAFKREALPEDDEIILAGAVE